MKVNYDFVDLQVKRILDEMKELSNHIDQIRKICASNNVKTLFAFGSIITEEFPPDSDIDLVVEIDENDPVSYSDDYFNVKFGLEKILDRRIDLLELKAIKNPYLKKQIEKSKVLVYGR